MTNANTEQPTTGTDDPLDFLDPAIEATTAMQESEAPQAKKSHTTKPDKAVAALANI